MVDLPFSATETASSRLFCWQKGASHDQTKSSQSPLAMLSTTLQYVTWNFVFLLSIQPAKLNLNFHANNKRWIFPNLGTEKGWVWAKWVNHFVCSGSTTYFWRRRREERKIGQGCSSGFPYKSLISNTQENGFLTQMNNANFQPYFHGQTLNTLCVLPSLAAAASHSNVFRNNWMVDCRFFVPFCVPFSNIFFLLLFSLGAKWTILTMGFSHGKRLKIDEYSSD